MQWICGLGKKNARPGDLDKVDPDEGVLHAVDNTYKNKQDKHQVQKKNNSSKVRVYIECLYVMSTDMVWHAAIFIFITHLCFINHLICLFYLVILCCISYVVTLYVCVSKRQKITFCIQALHIHRHDKQTYKLTTYDIYMYTYHNI